MLEYSKLILSKVCFDLKLFEKELIKALKLLQVKEREILINWVKEKFPNKTIKV